MSTFTKWFLLNSIVVTALFFAEVKGALSTMIKSDSSYICLLIMVMYVVVSGVVGRFCYQVDGLKNTISDHDEAELLLKRTDVCWFIAEHFFSLGLLGTVLGLCIATATGLNANAQISDIISGLKAGLHTAFYTTICGIIFSIPLQAQLMILKFKLEK